MDLINDEDIEWDRYSWRKRIERIHYEEIDSIVERLLSRLQKKIKSNL